MMKRVLTFCSWMLVAPALALAAGPLTPPGAPTPTLKTLDEVEARIPISTAGFSITAPGSYYLTRDIVSTTIQSIRASDVTLDLNGFRMQGPGVGSGIQVSDGSNQLQNITIRNGVIVGFNRGIQFSNVANSELSGLKIENQASFGIYFVGGANSGNTIRRCSIRNAASGIALRGTLVSGNVISDCRVSEMESVGISLTTSGGDVAGNRILRCEVSNAGLSGIDIRVIAAGEVAAGNEVVDCLVSDTGGAGILLSAAAANSVCDGNVVRSCTVREATGTGIRAVGTTYCRIEGNSVSTVFTDGTGNHGLYVDGSKNLIIRNSCGGASDNIDIGPNNTYGPEVNVTGALSSTGNASHPFANFNLQ